MVVVKVVKNGKLAYLLDGANKPKKFHDQYAAVNFLLKIGYTWDDIKHIKFIEKDS